MVPFYHLIVLFSLLSPGSMRPRSPSDRSRRVAPNTFMDLQSAGRNRSAPEWGRM